MTALSACLLSVIIPLIINDQSVHTSLSLLLLNPHLSPRHNCPLCVFLLCLTINTEVLCPPVIITPLVLPVLHKFFTLFLKASMPRHDHSFRDTFPNLPLDDHDMFLCWCCPVREKDSTIKEALTR